MRHGFYKWASEFGFAILLLAGCLIGLSVVSVVAGLILAFIPAIGILILNLLTAAGEYTSRYLGYFLVACIGYALMISLFINDLVSAARDGSKPESGRTDIYLKFYSVLALYVLPTILWESNRWMGYR